MHMYMFTSIPLPLPLIEMPLLCSALFFPMQTFQEKKQ